MRLTPNLFNLLFQNKEKLAGLLATLVVSTASIFGITSIQKVQGKLYQHRQCIHARYEQSTNRLYTNHHQLVKYAQALVNSRKKISGLLYQTLNQSDKDILLAQLKALSEAGYVKLLTPGDREENENYFRGLSEDPFKYKFDEGFFIKGEFKKGLISILVFSTEKDNKGRSRDYLVRYDFNKSKNKNLTDLFF